MCPRRSRPPARDHPRRVCRAQSASRSAIEDASKLAANAVCLGDTLVMAGCSERLRGTLEERGYRVATTPLRSFLRSGGAAFCLTLRLDRQSQPGTTIAQAAVA